MYKPPPKRELTEEERITLNMGGTLEPTAPPGGIAGTGIGFMQSRDSAKPPPPPEAPGEYKKKGQESNGVMAMMDMMVADLEKEMQEAEVDEKNQLRKDARTEETEALKKAHAVLSGADFSLL